jgi:hypothetical protein
MLCPENPSARGAPPIRLRSLRLRSGRLSKVEASRPRAKVEGPALLVPARSRGEDEAHGLLEATQDVITQTYAVVQRFQGESVFGGARD